MDSIPQPLEFVLDANDENLIFSIPDEPIDVDDGRTKDETKDEIHVKRKKNNEIYVGLAHLILVRC
jgi:hypothetical protein